MVNIYNMGSNCFFGKHFNMKFPMLEIKCYFKK